LILVDTASRRREEKDRPIRVALIGAGFMAQGLANQITHSVPGMRVASVSQRLAERSALFCHYEFAVPDSRRTRCYDPGRGNSF
jgi:predicted homoserine dehydrogenase-like protein